MVKGGICVMQPLTAKEMEYIVDSISNEDLLLKQYIAVASQTQNNDIRNLCLNMIQRHQHRFQTLRQSLEQHLNVAPVQPQAQ